MSKQQQVIAQIESRIRSERKAERMREQSVQRPFAHLWAIVQGV